MKKVVLHLIFLYTISTLMASGQTGGKPKAILFDEFNFTNQDVVRERTQRLKKKLQENRSLEIPPTVYLAFFYNKRPSFDIRRLVADTLHSDCRDCFGIDPPRITFVTVSDSREQKIQFWLVPFGAEAPPIGVPKAWFAPIDDPNKPAWEILPQEAKPGEVILSKRNELGILSNFAATPFVLEGKRYASVEGFWQMMLYPEGPDDERAKAKNVEWKYSREQVAQMTAFEAKAAGTLAEENMKKLGIDWVTYQGKRFPYRSQTPGEHYRLILAAMRAKLEQNLEVKRVLLATGDLILKPDHVQEPNAPPEWKYNEIWMLLRSESRL